MLHRRIIRDAFDPEQIALVIRAYERALDVVLRFGYDDGDPNVKENLAVHIIEAGKESPDLSLIDMANRAIARYRAHRETLQAIAAKARCRRAESKPARTSLTEQSHYASVGLNKARRTGFNHPSL